MAKLPLNLSPIIQHLTVLEQYLAKDGPAINQDLESRIKATQQVAQSWSQSSLVPHTNLYYGDFEQPPATDVFDIEWGLIHGMPEGWFQRTEEEVLEAIEALGPDEDLSATEVKVRQIQTLAEALRDIVLPNLSPIESMPGFTSETQMWKEIESLKLSPKPGEYVAKQLRIPSMSRDAAAMSAGARAPYHLLYRARIEALLGTMGAAEELAKRTRRLVNQLEVKQVVSAGDHSIEALERISRLLTRFHIVARQLRVRHSSRSTLEIADEYDVQDLLHGLLRVYFDDVREEEWTPSYAGGSSRVDFLLKKERIVIEVKKTRVGLADKEIGEQLIIDAARYRVHPECSTLICFVYDPEARIRNPAGLRADLEVLASTEVAIRVFIEPSF